LNIHHFLFNNLKEYIMTKHEDNPDMNVLKTASCDTLSGRSKLTYQIGRDDDSSIHLRISKNSGGGYFSDEWIALDDILQALKKRPKGSPVLSHFITPLLKGKSVNTSAFLLAVLSHLKLVRPLAGKKRQHELTDPQPFLDQVDKLTSEKASTKTGGSTARRPAKKSVAKKASST
jgi:hypothetical protein